MKKVFITFVIFIFSFLVGCVTVPKQTNDTTTQPEEPMTAVVEEEVVVEEEKVVVTGEFILPDGVTSRETTRGTLLIFSTNALFAYASSDLPDTSYDVFSAAKTFLNNNTNVSLMFETHTGNIGEAGANYRLSVTRKNNANAFMRTMENMPLDRIEPIALGEALPISEDQRKLRRYEFIIIRNQADKDKYYNFINTLDVQKESDGKVFENM